MVADLQVLRLDNAFEVQWRSFTTALFFRDRTAKRCSDRIDAVLGPEVVLPERYERTEAAIALQALRCQERDALYRSDPELARDWADHQFWAEKADSFAQTICADEDYAIEFRRRIGAVAREMDILTNPRRKCYALSWPLGGHKYVCVSCVGNVADGGKPETYIFPCDERGVISSWAGLPGSFRGDHNRAEALRAAGYRIE